MTLTVEQQRVFDEVCDRIGHHNSYLIDVFIAGWNAHRRYAHATQDDPIGVDDGSTDGYAVSAKVAQSCQLTDAQRRELRVMMARLFDLTVEGRESWRERDALVAYVESLLVQDVPPPPREGE